MTAPPSLTLSSSNDGDRDDAALVTALLSPTRDPVGRARRWKMAVFAAANALAAWFGAVGLATGVLDLGTRMVARLPLASPVLAGTALATFVAVPLSVLAWAASRGTERTDAVAIVAGGLLVVWIAGQLAILRTFSWFQPVYALIGIGLVVAGSLARRSSAAAP